MLFSQLRKGLIRGDGSGVCRQQNTDSRPDVAVFKFGSYCLGNRIAVSRRFSDLDWASTFLIVAARLWRLPLSLGGCKTASPQLNKSSHLGVEVGSCTTDRNNEAKCDAQANRADLGICFIKAQSGGNQTGLLDTWKD